MKYVHTIWNHDDNDIGVFFYYEIDDDGYIVRQIEIYKDFSFGIATKDFEYGNTFISDEKIEFSDIDEIIVSDEDGANTFYITEIQFNCVWNFFIKLTKI